MTGHRKAVVVWGLALVAALSAGATVVVSIEEALEMAFPDAAVERETLFLTDDQVAEVAGLSGFEAVSAVVTRYVATSNGGSVAGYAYLDTHRVRTLPETVIVVVGPGAEVLRVEVVVFREPLDYMPREGWYRQYDGRKLDDDLALKRGIRSITGATLTARATTEAVRRVLAIHEVTSTGSAP